jgi:DNA-binding NtrC family response regulator
VATLPQSEASARETLVRPAILVVDAVVSMLNEVAVATALATAVDPRECSLKRVSRLAAGLVEAALITRMLQPTHGNRKQAAANLGISYKALLYKAKEHSLGT